jgi:hypothetical protein
MALTAQAIRNVARRYQEGGLDRALYEKQRPGAAEVLDDSQKQRLTAMVAGTRGRARWTARLVPEEAVKRKLVPRVTGNDPHASAEPRPEAVAGKKCAVVADLDDDYIAKMEDVLEVYERPYRERSRRGWFRCLRRREVVDRAIRSRLQTGRGVL